MAESLKSLMTLRQTSMAYEFALANHGTQRYGEHPYVFHLGKVVAILMDCNVVDPVSIQGAWLHDVVEDTGVNIAEVEQKFGKAVADIVWACSGFGRNRRERNADIATKLMECSQAVPVKIADRVANVENALQEKPELLPMYVKEHDAFHALVGELGTCPQPLMARWLAAHERACKLVRVIGTGRLRVV